VKRSYRSKSKLLDYSEIKQKILFQLVRFLKMSIKAKFQKTEHCFRNFLVLVGKLLM